MAYKAWWESLPMEKEMQSFQLLSCWCCAVLLGKGLGIFFSFIILCWQPKIMVRPETQWELRNKTWQRRKGRLRKKDQGECIVWVNLKRTDRNWAWTRLPCNKDWNGKHIVLCTLSRSASADTVGLETQGLLLQSQVYGNDIKKMSYTV